MPPPLPNKVELKVTEFERTKSSPEIFVGQEIGGEARNVPGVGQHRSSPDTLDALSSEIG